MLIEQLLDMAVRCHCLAEACTNAELAARLREHAAEYCAKARALQNPQQAIRPTEQSDGK